MSDLTERLEAMLTEIEGRAWHHANATNDTDKHSAAADSFEFCGDYLRRILGKSPRIGSIDAAGTVPDREHATAGGSRIIASGGWDGTGIHITSETFAGIHGGYATFHVTADASELEAALATLKEALVPVAAALEGLPAGLRSDAEVALRIGENVWCTGEGRAIGDMCEDVGRMRVQRASEGE